MRVLDKVFDNNGILDVQRFAHRIFVVVVPFQQRDVGNRQAEGHGIDASQIVDDFNAVLSMNPSFGSKLLQIVQALFVRHVSWAFHDDSHEILIDGLAIAFLEVAQKMTRLAVATVRRQGLAAQVALAIVGLSFIVRVFREGSERGHILFRLQDAIVFWNGSPRVCERKRGCCDEQRRKNCGGKAEHDDAMSMLCRVAQL
mmetsp:Transcript_3175/g.8993  ORF Transcript_3175/g.8993 Transcript_3175/m.8993 type:complete len:200 (+) Transcript_3175:1657-2256(+)